MSVRFLIVRRIQGDRHHGKQTYMSICRQSIGRYTIVFGENILSAVYILSQDLGLLLPKKRLNACCGDIWLQKPICIAEKRCTIFHGCFCIFQENIFRSGMSVSERKAGCINFFAKEKISAFFPVISKEGKEILYLCVEKDRKMDGSSAGFCGARAKILLQR